MAGISVLVRRAACCIAGLIIGVTTAASAVADSPTVKMVTAPLVTPAAAWSYYDNVNPSDPTHHTNGLDVTLDGNGQLVNPPEIKAQARSLGAGRLSTDDFVQAVFDYVRNNIAVEYRFGLGKGGHGALIDQSGTPFDQAELAVQLLTEGGVSATYKVGTITLGPQDFGLWSGLVTNLNDSAQTFSVDAASACQFLADGGIPATISTATAADSTSCAGLTGSLTSVTLGHIWVQANGKVFDPSFKHTLLRSGIDVPSAMGCGTAAAPTCANTATAAALSGATQSALNGAPTIANLNEGALNAQLHTYAANLETYVRSNKPDAPIEALVGGQLLDTTYSPVASASLPYSGTTQYTWSGQIPDQFRTTLRIVYPGTDPTHSIDQTHFGDELAQSGLIITCCDFGLVSLGNQIATVETTGPLTMTVAHPYAASGGTYADDTVSWISVPVGSSQIVLSIGEAGPSRVKSFAELVRANFMSWGSSTDRYFNDSAAFFAQESQAARLIGGLTHTRITHQHIVGIAAALFDLATTVSVSSANNDATARGAAFSSVTLMGSLLEGSVPQQSQDSWQVYSTPAMFQRSNAQGTPFVYVTPSNYSAVSSSLSYSQFYTQPQISAGNTLIIPQLPANYDPTVIITGGTYHLYNQSMLSFGGSSEAYMAGIAKGGGADPNVDDPLAATLGAVDRSPAVQRARGLASVGLTAGNLSLSPAPDLTTGVGSFPLSLSVQRTYISANGYADKTSASTRQLYQYAGPDAAVFGRLGGGWVHNFQVTATLGNDGLVGLGGERGLHAVAAIAALETITNESSSLTFQNRLTAVFAANWLAQQFINNTVAVALPPSSQTFVRLPSGAFVPPSGSQDRVTQTGARSAPLAYTYDSQAIPNPITSVAFNYGLVGLTYTQSGGAAITFSPGQWSNTPVAQNVYKPAFYPTLWTFPNGTQVNFTYANVVIPSANPSIDYSINPVQYGKELTRVSNTLGRSLTFTVSNHIITRVTDETGRYASYALTCSSGELLSCDAFTETDPLGNVTRYEYAPDANSPDPTSLVRSNYKLRRWFTPTDVASSRTTPYLNFQYDNLLRASAITDDLGHVSQYYPGSVAGEQWKKGQLVHPTGATSTAIFNQWDRPIATIDELGRTSTFLYDDAHRQILATNPELDGVETRYDARSNVTSRIRHAKPGSGLADLTTSITYLEAANVDPCVNLATCNSRATQTDARGAVTNYSWDGATGSLTQIVRPADANGNSPQSNFGYTSYSIGGVSVAFLSSRTEKISTTASVTTTYAYNTANKYVLQSETADSGGLALTTSVAFDPIGNPVSVTDPRSNTANFVWDADRRLQFNIRPDPDGAGPLPRPATRATYDADSLIVQVDKGTTTTITGSDFVAMQRVINTFDLTGNKVRSTLYGSDLTTALGVTQMAYDADDRVVCAAVRMNPAGFASPPTDACTLGTPAGSVQDRITKTIYDPAGEVIQTLQGFGTADQRTSETFCKKASGWDYTADCYTPNGKVQYQADANGNLTKLIYDGFDRLATMNLPLTAPAAWAWDPADYETYTYDANNNRLSLRKRDGRFISWCYDALDREVKKYVSGTETNAPISCTLDLSTDAVTGPALTANDVATTYDLLHHKLTASFAAGGSVVRTYDPAGRLLTETAGGRQMAYGYDAAGNRNRITWPDATPFFVNYSYDALNHLTLITDSAGVTLASFTYDGLGHRTQITRNGGAGATTTYGFDNADRLTNMGQDLLGTTNDLALCFLYNPAGQVTTRGMSTTSTNCLTGGSATAYDWPAPTTPAINKTYDGLNRDAAIVTASGYDANGNLTNDGTRVFTYDLENRLLSASAPTAISLTYDPRGRLQTTTVGAAQTNFLYDGDRLAAEYDSASGNLLRRYVHGTGTDEPLVWYEYQAPGGAPLRWLHSDHQGSVIGWSDGTGTAGETYAYGAYGEPRNNSWSGSRFRYTGQIAIPEAALYHYKARVYDSMTGRFLQTDPIGYKSDLDLYAYVGEDPVDRIDPTGLCFEDFCAVETVGAVSMAAVYWTAGGLVAVGVCVQTCGAIHDKIGNTASGIWNGIFHSDPFKTPGGREIRDHGKKGDGGEYIRGKGWKPGQVDDIIKDPNDRYPAKQGDSRTGQGATVYVDKNGNFVVVNDKGQVVQVNDRNNPRQEPPDKPPEKPPEKSPG